MDINKNNYEIYFLDYREGNLNPFRIAELMTFLEQNPVLKKEFEDFENITVKPDKNIIFVHKNFLRKTVIITVDNINEDNYEDFFIADLEGDLNYKESKNVILFLEKNPFLKKEYNLFKKTYLIPDKNIVYTQKTSLKKFILPFYKKKSFYSTVSVAASVLIFLSIYILNNNNNSLSDKTIADNSALQQQIKEKDIQIIKNKDISYSKKNKKTCKIVKPINIINKNNNISITKNDYNIHTIKTIKVTKLTENKKQLTFKQAKRHYYSDIYSYLQLKNTNLFQQYKQEIKLQDYMTLKEYAFAKIKKIISKNNNKLSDDKLSMWDLADVGIKKFNKLTDNNIKLNRKVDDNGNMVSFAFGGKNFEYYRSK